MKETILLIIQAIFQLWFLSLVICVECNIRPDNKEELTWFGKTLRIIAYNLFLIPRIKKEKMRKDTE